MTPDSDSVSQLEWLVGVLVWPDLDDLTNSFTAGYRAGI